MTYDVFSGTLNPTQINKSFTCAKKLTVASLIYRTEPK